MRFLDHLTHPNGLFCADRLCMCVCEERRIRLQAKLLNLTIDQGTEGGTRKKRLLECMSKKVDWTEVIATLIVSISIPAPNLRTHISCNSEDVPVTDVTAAAVAVGGCCGGRSTNGSGEVARDARP